MNTANLDIVIPIKRSGTNEELRYCLRSIAKNMPHRKVFLVGHKPAWATNVEYISTTTTNHKSRFSRIASAINDACHDPRVSSNFVRFDDDFYAVRSISELQVMHRGNLSYHIAMYDKLPLAYVNYGAGLQRTERILRRLGIWGELLSYEVHMPMEFNKHMLLEVSKLVRGYNSNELLVHYRTLYGNYYRLGGQQVADTKILRVACDPSEKHPDATFISSSNVAFERGLMGAHIRSLFPEKCKYEEQ